jgi:TetR/AcrR family transcriptional regulator, lmrAB and yxaGH operons repressor
LKSVPQVPVARPTRDRMVDSALALLRERSSAGVTIDAVLAHSGAPRGSVYHHFPGGRDQLVREAVERSGRYVARLIAEADDAPDVVQRFVEFWEQVLTATDYLAGCPVVALTVDAGEAEQPLVEEIFAEWHTRLLEVFTRHGIDAPRAARLATLTIASTEGAVLLCRAQRSAEPLHAVAAELRLLLNAVPTT